MACTRQALSAYLDALLSPRQFRDYCPNGLQVEGAEHIAHLVTGVTASQALLDAAVASGADAILVHHGYFWRAEEPAVVGMKAARLRTLMRADINLFAYHLPIDWHPVFGNNVLLGQLMGVEEPKPLDPADPNLPLFYGQLPQPVSLQTLCIDLAEKLGRAPMSVGQGEVQKLVWCTGAGQHYIEQAADAGAHVYVTGEVSEQTIHVAKERGICFIAAGHHATERYGVQAVGEQVANALDCTHQYIEIENPA
ncbi:MAG: Nif3-like dinuclear metal center hexameric protein [Luminiphilus sp.]|jgi:dinuclear metal center YbgI/SA1388 family protein|nr:Nif3-like dinuclear metal center hexameric protein [Luminiphilus sp.]